jgi:hypothetical protein
MMFTFPVSMMKAVAAANTHSLALARTSSQYAYAADHADWDLTAVTYEVNVNLTTLPANFETYYLIGNYDAAVGGTGFYIYNISGTYYLYVTWLASIQRTMSVTFSPSTATWLHLAVSLEDTGPEMEAIFYVNGSQQGSTQTNSNDPITTGSADPMTIGANTSGNNCLNGKIDDVRVWSDVRTSTEISNNRSAELSGSEAGLVAYWKLNNNGDDSQSDGTHDLTLSGSPSYSTDTPF